MRSHLSRMLRIRPIEYFWAWEICIKLERDCVHAFKQQEKSTNTKILRIRNLTYSVF